MASIKLINNTNENIRIAIFKKPYKSPSIKIIPWNIVNMPRSGSSTNVEIPDNHQVYVNYSLDSRDREDPNGGIKTPLLDIDTFTAKFIVKEEKNSDGNSSVAVLERVFTDLFRNEIHIENQASFPVWGHILLKGLDVYPPQIISPGRTLLEDIRSPHFVAIIDEFVFPGNAIKVEELSSEPMEIVIDEIITVSGDRWQGYSLSHGSR